MIEIETLSKIKYPYCGFEKIEKMPINECQYFYFCEKCQKVLKPKAGDCCIFCSYGSVKCPPKQGELNKRNDGNNI